MVQVCDGLKILLHAPYSSTVISKLQRLVVYIKSGTIIMLIRNLHKQNHCEEKRTTLLEKIC